MFIKPFRVKNNIQMNGSEMKKIREKVAKQFPLISENSLKILLPNKAAFHVLKIVTHAEVAVTVYTVDKRPMFFEIKEIYPTLYALWLVNDLLPLFTTVPNVLPKLANGADLMLPGVVKEGNDMKSFGRFNRDDIVGVNLTSNKGKLII